MSFHATLPFLLFQSVWVVDDNGGPGVDFTDIPPAIAAAADGDILLVKAGTYAPFTLSGKGLRILGDGPQVTKVGGNPPSPPVGTAVISNVPSSSFVYIEGLHFRATGFFGINLLQPLQVSGAGTRVALRDVVVGQTGGSLSGFDLQPGLGVDGALVHLFGSSVFGTGPIGCNADAGAALRVSLGGLVHAAGSSFIAKGPQCCSPISACPSAGGPGILVAPAASGPSTRAWIADSTVKGGPNAILPGSTTGPGLRVDSGTARVSGGGTSFVQGGALAGGGGCGVAVFTTGSAEVVVHSAVLVGCPGQTIPITSGPGIALGAPPLPVLRATGDFTLSGNVTLSLTDGPPGAPFAIAIDEAPAHFGIPGPFLGELLIGPPPSLFLLSGGLSASGEFSLTIPLSGAPSNLAYLPLFLQAAAFDAATSVWRLSNAAVVLLRP
ncbi:MAG: hypothetical protein L0323_14640 [Planctomycetes bacterium]|nr:hypothetical protein [Planctomycetota bacterium]